MTEKIGLLVNADHLSGTQMLEIGQRAEDCGFESIWVPEIFGREPFVSAGALLAATKTIVVGTGIANVYARDAIATRQAAATLAELYPDRFLLGLSVSNPMVNEARGHRWQAPVDKLEAVLDGMEAAQVMFGKDTRMPIYIAGHGPKILKLAGERGEGGFIYLQPLATTTQARGWLGEGRSLNVLLPCVMQADQDKARTRGRKAINMYLSLPNYHRAWQRAGYDRHDWEHGGSDRLVDDLVAWGDPATVADRIKAQYAAGADRVVVIANDLDDNRLPDFNRLQAVLESLQ